MAVLKQPLAIAATLLLVTLCGLGARALYPLILGWFTPDVGDDVSLVERARRAEGLCGTVSTGEFEGEYEVLDDQGAYSDFRIMHDRITYGARVAHELCLTKLKEIQPGALRAEAVLRWHTVPAEGAAASEPPDNLLMLMDVRLDRGSDKIAFSMAPITHPNRATRIFLRRR